MGRASELGDQRKLVGEHRATSEKGTEGWSESERSGETQRYTVWHISSFGEAEKRRQDSEQGDPNPDQPVSAVHPPTRPSSSITTDT